MRFEEIRGLRVPKVGFGTWSIGGGSRPDTSRDAQSLTALRSAITLGYTHFDTAESYADGHCEELLGRAIQESSTARSSLFITSKVRPENLSAQNVVNACERSLERLGTTYLDLYLIHWPNRNLDLGETFGGLNQLVRDGKVRHVGVSNFDLGLLQRSQKHSQAPILTDQVPYSISDRTYARNGVIDFCQRNDILVTAYSPLDQGSFKPGKRLVEMARERGVSPEQLAIAWLCSQRRVITIPMSADPQHQRENLEAADIVLAPADLAALN